MIRCRSTKSRHRGVGRSSLVERVDESNPVNGALVGPGLLAVDLPRSGRLDGVSPGVDDGHGLAERCRRGGDRAVRREPTTSVSPRRRRRLASRSQDASKRWTRSNRRRRGCRRGGRTCRSVRRPRTASGRRRGRDASRVARPARSSWPRREVGTMAASSTTTVEPAGRSVTGARPPGQNRPPRGAGSRSPSPPPAACVAARRSPTTSDTLALALSDDRRMTGRSHETPPMIS